MNPGYVGDTPGCTENIPVSLDALRSENFERLFRSYLLDIPYNHVFFTVFLTPRALPRRGRGIDPLYSISLKDICVQMGLGVST